MYNKVSICAVVQGKHNTFLIVDITCRVHTESSLFSSALSRGRKKEGLATSLKTSSAPLKQGSRYSWLGCGEDQPPTNRPANSVDSVGSVGVGMGGEIKIGKVGRPADKEIVVDK